MSEEIEQRLSNIRKRRLRRKTIAKLFLAAFTAYLMTARILGIALVHGSSMEPSLHDGDILIFNRLDQSYEQGDIAVIKTKNIEQIIVKRIIGTPKETVTIENDRAINLSEGEYFVMGDNKDNSTDSRDFGNIKEGELMGKVVLILSRPHQQKGDT